MHSAAPLDVRDERGDVGLRHGPCRGEGGRECANTSAWKRPAQASRLRAALQAPPLRDPRRSGGGLLRLGGAVGRGARRRERTDRGKDGEHRCPLAASAQHRRRARRARQPGRPGSASRSGRGARGGGGRAGPDTSGCRRDSARKGCEQGRGRCEGRARRGGAVGHGVAHRRGRPLRAGRRGLCAAAPGPGCGCGAAGCAEERPAGALGDPERGGAGAEAAALFRRTQRQQRHPGAAARARGALRPGRAGRAPRAAPRGGAPERRRGEGAHRGGLRAGRRGRDETARAAAPVCGKVRARGSGSGRVGHVAAGPRRHERGLLGRRVHRAAPRCGRAQRACRRPFASPPRRPICERPSWAHSSAQGGQCSGAKRAVL
mmetsp:Transcript_33424/g.104172  ORF Transcript_33424/g.104172 Transcript_33424/m.104172 type:complete len:375 (+) Transcript_33424:658-1782(+)